MGAMVYEKIIQQKFLLFGKNPWNIRIFCVTLLPIQIKILRFSYQKNKNRRMKMFSKEKIVEEELVSCKANFNEQDDWQNSPPKIRQIRKRIFDQVDKTISSLKGQAANTPFACIEKN